MTVQRKQYLNDLIEKKDNGRIKIITGIRRCGKSYLLFDIYKKYLLENNISSEQIIEIALDNFDFFKYRDPFKLNEFIQEQVKEKDKKYYIFIDEVQFCVEVENPFVLNGDKITFVDILLSLMKNKNLDIYVTGSNSKMLSKDVLTQFRDRGDEIRVFPLSFAEVNSYYNDRNLAWEQFILCGGMPFVLQLKTFEQKSLYLKNLFDETYLKDVIERNKINNEVQSLDILLNFVSSTVGSLINPTKLSRRFASECKINISNNTIFNYLTYFEDSYVLYCAKRYDVKGSKYFSTPNKYYFADIGLRNARLNFRQIEETHLMENIIYNDLLRRGFNVDVGVVEQFSKVNGKTERINLEIDFILNKGNKRYYIQSALVLNSQDKIDQERNSLKKVEDNFQKIIIVRDDIVPRYDEFGIYYIGVKDFLLDEDFFNR